MNNKMKIFREYEVVQEPVEEKFDFDLSSLGKWDKANN